VLRPLGHLRARRSQVVLDRTDTRGLLHGRVQEPGSLARRPQGGRGSASWC
jgi:hypothetical protein